MAPYLGWNSETPSDPLWSVWCRLLKSTSEPNRGRKTQGGRRHLTDDRGDSYLVCQVRALFDPIHYDVVIYLRKRLSKMTAAFLAPRGSNNPARASVPEAKLSLSTVCQTNFTLLF
jgi:hypothetical protein